MTRRHTRRDPGKLDRLVEDIRLSARENAGQSVRENHELSGYADDHPSYHGYYVATARGIIDALTSDSDYGEARDMRREYQLDEPLSAGEAATLRKRLNLDTVKKEALMRRSRPRRPSRDVQVIIRDGGKPSRSTKPRYGAKAKYRGPRRSWRGARPMGHGLGLTRKSAARDPVRLPRHVKKVLERGDGALLVRMNDGYGEDTYGIVEVHKGGRTIIRYQDSERNIRQLWSEEKWGKTRRDPQRDPQRTYYIVTYRTRFESSPSYGDTHDFKRFSDKGQAIAFRNRIVRNGGEAKLRRETMTATEARMSRGTNARFRKSYPGAEPFIDSKTMTRVNSRERRRAGRWHKRMSGSSRDRDPGRPGTKAQKRAAWHQVEKAYGRRDPARRFKSGDRVVMPHPRGTRLKGYVIGDVERGFAIWDHGEPLDRTPIDDPRIIPVSEVKTDRDPSRSRRDPQKLETLKHYSGKALLKLLKQAQAKGDEATEEAIGRELDKRAKKHGFY